MADIALVTGGAVRLGRAFALRLAGHGYDIALHYGRSRSAAEATAAEIRALGRECRLFPFDLSQNDAGPLFDQVRAWGPVQVLVNSASLYDQAPIASTDRALLAREFAVNLFAPFDLIRAFAAGNDATAGAIDEADPARRPGVVVNILDNKIAFHQFKYAAYLLTKKTLAELTRLAAMEFAPRLRVNGLAPGVILPAEERTSEYVEWREKGIPLERKGQVEELLRGLDYLLDNEFVTGQILFVDGGESLTNIGRNAADYQDS